MVTIDFSIIYFDRFFMGLIDFSLAFIDLPIVFINFSLVFMDLSMVSSDLSDVASWPLMLCKFKEALQSLKLFSLGPCSLARPRVWPRKLKAKGWEKSASKFCLGWALSN